MERLIFLMKHLLLTTFFLIPVLGLSQVTQEWVAKYNGPAGSHDGATAMVVDSAGNVYVTGFSYDRKSGPFEDTFNDIVTIKYNTAGEQQWAARYDGPVNGADHPVGIALDAAGNVYVAGYSAGSETGDRSYDYLTIKYDANGNELWVARYNGPGNGWDEASALEVDAAGNVYVTGFVYVAGHRSGTDYDYATIKYNTAGVQQWVKRYNGPSSLRDQPTALVLDEAGYVYVTGGSRRDTVTVRLGAESAVTIKYDTNGNEQWVASYSGPENMSSVYTADLALDTVGNVYVTGRSSSELDSDDLPMYDYTTLKYDTTGALQWVRFYDSSELYENFNASRDDFARALAVDAEGNVFVTGQTGYREEDPDNAFLTIKYSTLGNVLWAVPFDGPGGPQGGGGEDIVLDAEGNVYVTGSITMTQEWQDRDYATIKYSPEGVQQWLMTHDGPGNYIDDARAIGIDAAGNVYVTGRSFLDDYYTVVDSEYATIKYSQTSCTPPTPAITVTPTSDVYTGGDASTIYLGYGPQSVRLVANGGERYTWSPAEGLSDASIADPVFTPTAAGSYTFTVTAYNGVCSATALVTIKVVDARCGTQGKVRVCHNGRNLCLSPSAARAHLRNHKSDRLGICGEAPDTDDVITLTIPLKVFPNPFFDWTNVEFSLPVGGPFRLELYNAGGKLLGVVAEGVGQTGQVVKLDLRGEQLREGIYYLKLITSDQVQTLRLVLEK